MRRLPIALVAFVTLALIVSNSPASAQWSHDAFVNTLVRGTPQFEYASAIAPDGVGGAFIAWGDVRNGVDPDVYVQHYDAAGRALWGPSGVLAAGGTGYQTNPQLLADGVGGVFVTYVDLPNVATPDEIDVRGQRLNAAGTRLWGTNGVAVCAAANTQIDQQMVPDGAGGFYAAWRDLRSGIRYDVFAQRIRPTSAAVWAANGIAICSATGDKDHLRAVEDGRGGLYLAWTDPRTGDEDIYAERLDSLGVARFGSNGRAICTAANSQQNAEIAADPQGGLLLAWQDLRNGNFDVFGQRLSTDGTERWGANGRSVITFTGGQVGPTIASDGAGGALIAWTDSRTAILQVRAQHVGPFGSPLWPSDMLVSAGQGEQLPHALPDGQGGMLCLFEDFRDSGTSWFVQRVNGAGATLWASGGAPFCRAGNGRYLGGLVTDGRGGLIAVWEDLRINGADRDIYADRLEANGYLGTPEPVITAARDVPNDQGGQVKVSWLASWPELPPTDAVDHYNVFRSVPPALAASRQAQGTRVASAGPCEGGDCLVQSTFAGQTYFWEFVSRVEGLDLDGYSAIVPTLGDSAGGSNPRTLFMVQARSASGALSWSSPPDSAYSVDNLAPATPALFAGTYGSGGASLQWGANQEPDLAGYLLYRGTTPGFAPSPANLVATTTEATYLDAPAAPGWYKLAAVDSHGNVSGYATLLPSGTTDAPGGELPAVLALSPPSPNPATGAATLRFALPAAGTVRLAIFDAQGRTVRALPGQAWPAGTHAWRWDGLTGGGSRAGAGVYLVRLETSGRVLTRRFAWMP